MIGKCESHYLPEVCPSAPTFLLFIFAIILLLTSLLHNQFLILSLTLTKFDLILLSVQIVSLSSVVIDLVVVGQYLLGL